MTQDNKTYQKVSSMRHDFIAGVLVALPYYKLSGGHRTDITLKFGIADDMWRVPLIQYQTLSILWTKLIQYDKMSHVC